RHVAAAADAHQVQLALAGAVLGLALQDGALARQRLGGLGLALGGLGGIVGGLQQRQQRLQRFARGGGHGVGAVGQQLPRLDDQAVAGAHLFAGLGQLLVGGDLALDRLDQRLGGVVVGVGALAGLAGVAFLDLRLAPGRLFLVDDAAGHELVHV